MYPLTPSGALAASLTHLGISMPFRARRGQPRGTRDFCRWQMVFHIHKGLCSTLVLDDTSSRKESLVYLSALGLASVDGGQPVQVHLDGTDTGLLTKHDVACTPLNTTIPQECTIWQLVEAVEAVGEVEPCHNCRD